MSQSTIDNFNNKGTIKNTGTNQPSEQYAVSTGLFLYKSKIETLTNDGSISGVMGLSLNIGTIENFINKGTIESTTNDKRGAAISINTIRDSVSTINNLTNQGTIKSSSNGILTETGNTINTITNKGAIEADLNGISFFNYDDSSGEAA
ncbi:TPA: autotransporter outer membrane beta-barrel domain-containing protein, partial [Campylobacter jejuni]|nr:autotransporter outer membrane beta-barrel domain-containing protein [Campylobacter jejuni]